MKSMSITDDLVLAAAAMNRDQGHAAAFPMPTEADAMTMTSAYRQASIAMMLSHSPITQDVSNSGIGSNGNDDSALLSILIKQHHLRSMTEQLKAVRSFTSPDAILSTGGIPGATAGTGISITATTNNDGHQAYNPVTDNLSADTNHSAMLRFQIDLLPANANATVDVPQNLKNRSRKPNFAEKLHAMLNTRECRHAVKWLPSGRAFSIVDQNEFVKTVMPKFFREAKFDSFVRRLKRWGFRKDCSTMGNLRLNQPMYCHDMFCRDRPELCKIMNGKAKDVSAGQVNQLNMPGNASIAALLLSTEHQKQFCETPRFQEMQVQAKLRQLQQLRLRNQASLQHEMSRQQVARQQQVNHHLAMLAAASRTRDYSPSTSSYGSPQCSVYPDPAQKSMTLQDTTSPENVHPNISKSNDFVAQSMPPWKASPLVDIIGDIGIRTEEHLAILQHLQELKKKHRLSAVR